MSNTVGKIAFSKLSLWIVIIIAGMFYLFPNLLKVSTPYRFDMSRIKLGIDLRGGTYITLGVDAEKAVENRLASEDRSFETLFKKKLNLRPTHKEFKNNSLMYIFEKEEGAQTCYNVLKNEAPHLKVSRDGNKVIAILSSAEESKIKNDSVEQAIQVIENRLLGLGVEGIIVQRHGARQIIVQLPGVDDPKRVKDLITRRAHLEFKIIQESASRKDDLLEKFDYDLPRDKKILPGESTTSMGDDETSGTYYLVSAYPDLTGDHIVDARVIIGDFGEPSVQFKLDSRGGSIFKRVTGENVGRQLGIIIDDVVYSAPSISEAIGAEGRISGRYTMETAKDLSIVLKTGSFQAPVVYQEERRVGPSLGQDSINRGLMSCFVGLGLVFIFSIIVYKVAGLFAILALILNMFFILLFLSYFGATLTLPGIAGMALTIGMAIDASILIYEKIREELAEGESYRRAVDIGFNDAMAVILDSNITTFLTGLVLFYFGGPSIRGFAVTLMVGIVATILSGVYFLKALFDFVLSYTPFKKISI